MKSLAFYNLNDELFSKLVNIEELNEYRFNRFYDEDLSSKVKDVFLVNSFNGECKLYDKTYMIMDNLSVDDIKSLSNIFLKNNIEFNGIKILHTEKNSEWSLKDLFTEVNEEDKLFKLNQRLREVLISLNDYDLSKYPEEKTFALKKALMDGFLILNNKSAGVELVENAINSINYLKENLK